MKITTSKKVFYNKFNYKISLKIEGCNALRYHSIENSKLWLEAGKLPKFYLSDRTKLSILQNKETLILMCDILISYPANIWNKRIEGDCIDIYTSDEDLIQEIKYKLLDKIIAVFEPCEKKLSPGTIRVKKLPGDTYNFRVYLLPHKLKNNQEEKRKYIDWIKSQNNKIKITESVEKWFYKTEWNWDPRYILVDEESTLLMLKLRNADLVGRIYKFVV